MTNIRKLVNALPPHNKQLLTRLCAFLIHVAKDSAVLPFFIFFFSLFSDCWAIHKKVNKMSEQNLAIVFGPNLLRPKNDSVRRLIEDALFVNGVILALLQEFHFLVTVCTLPHLYSILPPLFFFFPLSFSSFFSVLHFLETYFQRSLLL